MRSHYKEMVKRCAGQDSSVRGVLEQSAYQDLWHRGSITELIRCQCRVDALQPLVQQESGTASSVGSGNSLADESGAVEKR